MRTESTTASLRRADAQDLLCELIARHGHEYLARELTRDVSTLKRWEGGEIPAPGEVWHALQNILRSGLEKSHRPADFTFIDLFAGIGGTRLGFEAAGGKCVFTCEWDKHCLTTYRAHFEPDHPVVENIRLITDSEISPTRDHVARLVPDHDVLVAGFPCQPFSIAGVSKKNSLGRAHGFACETEGTLFFDICRILEAKRPPAFMLENVKNLQSHDSGRTFQTILKVLKEELGYSIHYRVIDAGPWRPQHRERIFIVGFREPVAFSWADLEIPTGRTPVLGDILHSESGKESVEKDYTIGKLARVNRKYVLSDHLWQYLQDYARKHREAGNGFGCSVMTKKGVARTLSARYYKDGSEILISRGRGNPRRLTPRECARLMGFPDSFQIPVSDTQAYKQFGNSVVIPVVEAVAQAMAPHVISLRNRDILGDEQLAMVV